MATHSSILAWRLPWTEDHGGWGAVEATVVVGVRLDSVQKQEDNAPYQGSGLHQFSLIPYSKSTCIGRF